MSYIIKKDKHIRIIHNKSNQSSIRLHKNSKHLMLKKAINEEKISHTIRYIEK